MKKEILKKTFSANLQNVWIFAFFVNLYGILVVSGQKREIWYTRYIPLAPPPPAPQYRAWVLTGDISLRAKFYLLAVHMGPLWEKLCWEIFRSDNLTSTNLKPFLKILILPTIGSQRAQSVERLSTERQVVGSIPGAGPIPRVLK